MCWVEGDQGADGLEEAVDTPWPDGLPPRVLVLCSNSDVLVSILTLIEVAWLRVIAAVR